MSQCVVACVQRDICETVDPLDAVCKLVQMEDDRDVGVAKDVMKGRISHNGAVERNVGCSGLERGEHADEHRNGTFDEQADAVSTLDPDIMQVPSQGSRALVQLLVGDTGTVDVDNSQLFREGARIVGERVVHKLKARGNDRTAPEGEERMLVGLRQALEDGE